MEPYIKCRTGRKFDYAQPTAASVHVLDVAHAGAAICRFNGHTRKFFSINQHMVECAKLSMLKTIGLPVRTRYEMAYACLMHDAHESYIGDWPSPLKMVMGTHFRTIEAGVLHAVEEAFGVTHIMREHREHVKQVDLEMLFADAVRWGMDGTTLVSNPLGEGYVEIGSIRDWVPANAPVHFADATPWLPEQAKDEWLKVFHRLGGVNFSAYTAIGPVEGDFRLAA